jgi:hypothetical protein
MGRDPEARLLHGTEPPDHCSYFGALEPLFADLQDGTADLGCVEELVGETDRRRGVFKMSVAEPPRRAAIVEIGGLGELGLLKGKASGPLRAPSGEPAAPLLCPVDPDGSGELSAD